MNKKLEAVTKTKKQQISRKRISSPVSCNIVIPTDDILYSKSLDELLSIAEKLFPQYKKPKLSPYNFDLGCFPYGYCFNVTNSWYKWSAAKLEHKFGVYKNPKFCVVDFLKYVRDNKINVMKLADK